MVLGEGLADAAGTRHRMAGLLPVETSFATRKLHLGYRALHCAGGPFPSHLRGHEFHYSTATQTPGAAPLFNARNAAGRDLGGMGQRIGKVMGSYAHIIASAP
jgi:cobyrinic acid a,c-diamide synthase